jgi:hypothetical protein
MIACKEKKASGFGNKRQKAVVQAALAPQLFGV